MDATDGWAGSRGVAMEMVVRRGDGEARGAEGSLAMAVMWMWAVAAWCEWDLVMAVTVAMDV